MIYGGANDIEYLTARFVKIVGPGLTLCDQINERPGNREAHFLPIPSDVCSILTLSLK